MIIRERERQKRGSREIKSKYYVLLDSLWYGLLDVPPNTLLCDRSAAPYTQYYLIQFKRGRAIDYAYWSEP